jgi:hypothetical protein
VTVENTVDTGVGTHADILALGHLLPSPRISKPINSQRGDRESRSQKKGRRNRGTQARLLFLRGIRVLEGYKVWRGRPLDGGGKGEGEKDKVHSWH